MTIQIQDTVAQSMTSAKTLLFPVASMNHDPKLNQVFFDPEAGAAIAGFRRQVANFGVFLLRAQYGRHNEVEIGKNDFKRMSGNYNYLDKVFIEGNEGILGAETRNGMREAVNNEVTQEKIDAIRNKVEARYEVNLHPNTLYQFMESRYRDLGSTHRDRKINFEFTTGLPKMTVLAVPTKANGKVVMTTKVPNPKTGKVAVSQSFVDRNSVVAEKDIQSNRVYLVSPGTFDKKTGIRTVNVLRPYKEGIRVAMQGFKNGLIRPGDRAYGVNPDLTNGIKPTCVMDMPFMSSQNRKMIAGSPMLTFDLDMIYSLMKTLSAYPSVTLKFKDASSGMYFVAEGNEYLPTVEAIVGPTIQYVRGRTCLQ